MATIQSYTRYIRVLRRWVRNARRRASKSKPVPDNGVFTPDKR